MTLTVIRFWMVNLMAHLPRKGGVHGGRSSVM